MGPAEFMEFYHIDRFVNIIVLIYLISYITDRYSTRKLESPKWEIDHTETNFHQSKNPRMEGLVIMNCFV